jgi:hypothetical protein
MEPQARRHVPDVGAAVAVHRAWCAPIQIGACRPAAAVPDTRSDRRTAALELGYRVLRADTDVYFAEDPYEVLHGPLLSPFALVVQQDFGGPLGSRPACVQQRHTTHQPSTTLGAANAPAGSQIGNCGLRHGTALLNVGLLYARSRPGAGGFAVINDTWAMFHRKLSGPPLRPAHMRGAPPSFGSNPIRCGGGIHTWRARLGGPGGPCSSE